MTSWVRLWHDMPTDPKFRTIARASKQPLPVVIAIFTFILTDASANESERGRTTASDEDIASAFDLEESDVCLVRQAMQGRVLDGDILAGWEKRQPKREDNSAERAKAWREKNKPNVKTERSRTQPNAAERPDTDTDTDTEKKEVILSPKGAPKPKNGSRLSDDFVLPKAWGNWALENINGATVEVIRSQADQFKDYWTGKAGAAARKVDWEATWRNWMRNAKINTRSPPSQQRSVVTVLDELISNMDAANVLQSDESSLGSSQDAFYLAAPDSEGES